MGSEMCIRDRIYTDFLAYTEIARGLALLMGVELSLNFRQPLLAPNLQSFWQRWHITLTRWIFDYVQMPLARRYRSYFPRVIIVVCTFCLIGFWHGASWNFIVFGAFHGLLIVAWKPIGSILRKLFAVPEWYRKAFSRICLYVVLLFSAPMFYVVDVDRMLAVLAGMFSVGRPLDSLIYASGQLGVLFSLVGIAMLLVADILAERKNTEPMELAVDLRNIYRHSLVFMLVGLTLFFGNFQSEPFVYFQF